MTATSPFGSTAGNLDRHGVHPVGIPYPSGRHGYQPASEVERSLPLAGGLVACETCHSGEVTHPSRLTISNEGSRLCLVCHEK